MITKEAALKLAPQNENFVNIGVVGESDDYWVIGREPLYSGDEYDMPLPFIDKETGDVVLAVMPADMDLYDQVAFYD